MIVHLKLQVMHSLNQPLMLSAFNRYYLFFEDVPFTRWVNFMG